jgi:hypothetical protein
VGLGNPNLRVEVPDVGGGVLVALRRVLAEEIGAHARRDARRHAWLPAAAREWKRTAGGGGVYSRLREAFHALVWVLLYTDLVGVYGPPHTPPTMPVGWASTHE